MSKEDRFREIVVNLLGVDTEKVTDHASFKDDLGADSLDEVELMIVAESEFGVSITDAKWDQVVTFGDAMKLISQAAE